jgi:acetylornithine deacetylase/succinyl-diaminopimelate desuccinylase-like protein
LPTNSQATAAAREREALAAAVEASLPRLIDMTQQLVRVASPNPPSNTTAVAAVAEQLLADIPGVDIRRVEPEPGIVSLVVRVPGRGPGRRLIFNGHLDTFPLGDDVGWTAPPLSGELRDGRLYGRGVSDMKGGLASSILAAALLAERAHLWRGEVVLTLAADEENMGSLGTGYLLEHVPEAKGDANICGDVGSPMVVRFGEKGLLWIEVEARGTAAHGAHVHKGVNAIDRLREALDRVKDLERLPVEAPAAVTRAIAAAAPISEKLSGAGESATLSRVTVNIGTIRGGVSANLVPAYAIAQADIRLPVGITTPALEAKLDASLGRVPGVTWRALRRFEPNFTDPGHEIVARVRDAAAEVLGTPPAVNMRVGGSDSRWYRMHALPTVVYGLTPFNMGGPDEHILVDELKAVAKVHALAAFDFLTNRA